ncbi:MAG TPA: tetratricopeptide repeat protein [Allocoleopsis sp.]
MSHTRPDSHQSGSSVRKQLSQRCAASVDPVRRREYEAAIAHCDQMIARQPGNAEIWYERGEAQANLGFYAEAIASFNQALVLKPDHTEALVFRAVALIHLSGYEEALLSCNMALAVHPYHSEAWLYRGVALRYLKRYKEAYASYDSALGVRSSSDWRSMMAEVKARVLAYFPRWHRQS